MYEIMKKLRKSRKKITVMATPKHPIKQDTNWMPLVIAVIAVIMVIGLLWENDLQRRVNNLRTAEQIKMIDDSLLLRNEPVKKAVKPKKKKQHQRGIQRPESWVLDY